MLWNRLNFSTKSVWEVKCQTLICLVLFLIFYIVFFICLLLTGTLHRWLDIPVSSTFSKCIHWFLKYILLLLLPQSEKKHKHKHYLKKDNKWKMHDKIVYAWLLINMINIVFGIISEVELYSLDGICHIYKFAQSFYMFIK